MKVLVTGSTGMVGRNFMKDPRSSEFEIVSPSRQELNLVSFIDVFNFVKKHQPEVVVHCASRVGGIAANIANPVEFLSENLDINKNVIMASYNAGIKKLLNLSSSCVYPCHGQNPLRESQILTGELEPTNEGYAIAKIAALKLCSYISKSNSQYLYRTLIPCNLFGHYDHFDPKISHMIPAALMKVHKAFESNDPFVEIWGDGKARREFMFTADLVDCIYQCLYRFESIPDLMNVGIGHDYSITEYYQTIAEIIGYKGSFKYDLTKPQGMMQKLVDSSVVNQWGWTPKTDLKQGLKKTYEYYLRIKT